MIDIKNYFSVGEAAKFANVTSETLRHYDRIGLVKPSKKDEWTSYRYYTEQDLVKINTIRALQLMDLPLKKIREVLEFDDLEKIIDFLKVAEEKADEKIASLQYSKEKIQLARSSYMNNLSVQQQIDGIMIKSFPERVILLSDTMEAPTLDNLWGYLDHFYDKIEQSKKSQFTFEDSAGIYTEKETSRLFATCVRHANTDGLKRLPEGNYLCADCTEENRIRKIDELLLIARSEYHAQPKFIIQQIVISGILQWNYQVQMYLSSSDT